MYEESSIKMTQHDHHHFCVCMQGAATTCYVALHPGVKGVTGQYFVDSNIAKACPQARDGELAKKLWDFSLSMLKGK